MAERENLPTKLAAQVLIATTKKPGSLVGRGMAAVKSNKQLALTKNNDVRYRQARDIYNRWRYKERVLPLTEVLSSFQQLAEEGYGKAYFPLCMLHSGLQSIKDDPAQFNRFHTLAFNWLYANQLQNDPEIWHDLGAMYRDESNELANYWFQKAADAGDVSSMWELSGAYEYGNGVDQDWERSLYWQIKAAEAGHEGAQLSVAEMYEWGQGVAKDYEQSAYWYRKAAEQGNVDAQILFGSMYEYGRGINQSDEQAAYWYHKAAEQDIDGTLCVEAFRSGVKDRMEAEKEKLRLRQVDDTNRS